MRSANCDCRETEKRKREGEAACIFNLLVGVRKSLTQQARHMAPLAFQQQFLCFACYLEVSRDGGRCSTLYRLHYFVLLKYTHYTLWQPIVAALICKYACRAETCVSFSECADGFAVRTGSRAALIPANDDEGWR